MRGAYIGVEGVDAVGVRGLGRAQTLDVGSVLVDVYLNGFEVGGHLLHGFHILGAVNGGVALEQRIAVAVYLCHPFAAVCHIELAEMVARRTAFYGYQRPPTLMGIGVCLAQLCHGLEKSLARTLDVLGFKPTLHGEVVTYGHGAAHRTRTAHADVATYRHIAVYLLCRY